MKNNQVLSISLLCFSSIFVIITFLVFLTGGKNKYLVAKKLKMGAIIIGLTSIVNGCRPMVSCYRASMPDLSPVITTNESKNIMGRIILKSDDKEINFNCAYLFVEDISYRLFKGDKSVYEDSCCLVKNNQKTSLIVSLPEGLNNGNYSLKIFTVKVSEISKNTVPIKEFDLRIVD
jgi:hypothetical protein